MVFKKFYFDGCILFPIKETCLNTSWTVNLADVTKHKNEVLSWTRGYSSGNHDNYDFTINSIYDWIYPWFQSYFFKDALLQIFSISIILVIFLTILLNLLNLPKKKFHKTDYLISLVLSQFFFIRFFSS